MPIRQGFPRRSCRARWHLAVNDPRVEGVRIIDHAVYRTYDGLKVAIGVDMNRMDGLGLGWLVALPKENRPLMLAKSGGLPGFATYVALAPTRGVGVFVAVNRFDLPEYYGALAAAVHQLVAQLAPR
jgi:D-alanyl-D-alanine-carboxypeptidase/D-alanyl-D-alanine-endopeptidase